MQVIMRVIAIYQPDENPWVKEKNEYLVVYSDQWDNYEKMEISSYKSKDFYCDTDNDERLVMKCNACASVSNTHMQKEKLLVTCQSCRAKEEVEWMDYRPREQDDKLFTYEGKAK